MARIGPERGDDVVLGRQAQREGAQRWLASKHREQRLARERRLHRNIQELQ